MSTCPLCGTPTPLAHHGHRALCLPCTETELGQTYPEIQTRINALLQKGRTRKWRR